MPRSIFTSWQEETELRGALVFFFSWPFLPYMGLTLRHGRQRPGLATGISFLFCCFLAFLRPRSTQTEVRASGTVRLATARRARPARCPLPRGPCPDLSIPWLVGGLLLRPCHGALCSLLYSTGAQACEQSSGAKEGSEGSRRTPDKSRPINISSMAPSGGDVSFLPSHACPLARPSGQGSQRGYCRDILVPFSFAPRRGGERGGG